MKNFHQNLLYKKWFLIAVFLLIMNDFFLKHQFHNVLTGKLSDFVGLFAFPYFISLFSKRIKLIYFLTALFFMYWKIEASQPLIDYLNNVGFNLYRVVDYTDFMALLILPISYKYRQELILLKTSRVINTLIILVSCFSFVATTQRRIHRPPHVEKLGMKSEKKIEVSLRKEHLWDGLGYEPLYLNNGYYIILEDSIGMETYYKTTIHEKNDSLITIQIDSILEYRYSYFLYNIDSLTRAKALDRYRSMNSKDFEKIFEERIKGIE